MGWSVVGLSLVILCSVSSGSGVNKTAVVAPAASIKAKECVKKLEDLCPDTKSSMRPRHCADLLRAGQTTSGLYNIFLGKYDVKGKSSTATWTPTEVIQRRGQFGNRVYYFYRNWTEYATGFGDPAKEYWIGNRALHALTSNAECMKLRIVLKNHTGEIVSLDYGSFKAGTLSPIATTANFPLSTRTTDNMDYHCAVKFRGGWWYNQCHRANLNGLNLNGPHDSYADGIEWGIRQGSYHLQHYSYPSATIMTRPVK
ncbi:hypothetical protein HPB49_010168 [Dermacentor silvarum]|uniref:Uncharacterized protein n=1 Tax=Dermacentor silvarum TaxID=543639 RepID=A0ACB8D4H0_DERSI|nr:hypothetical protein HPB49_010168 [Dermacentor silvarum]